jgi:hypothetical protein
LEKQRMELEALTKRHKAQTYQQGKEEKEYITSGVHIDPLQDPNLIPNQHSLVQVNYHFLVARQKHGTVLLLNQTRRNTIKALAV